MRERRKKKRYPEIGWRILDAMSMEDRLQVPEENLRSCLAAYVEEIYPDVLFCTNVASDVELGWWKAKSQKAAGNRRGWPDLFIAKPMGDFHGCLIELKKDGESVLKKSGEPANKHIAEQLEILRRLAVERYCTFIVAGWSSAKNAVDTYLNTGRAI